MEDKNTEEKETAGEDLPAGENTQSEEMSAAEETVHAEEEGVDEGEAVPEGESAPEEAVTPEESTVPEEAAASEEEAMPEEAAVPEEEVTSEETVVSGEEVTAEESAVPEEAVTPEEASVPEEEVSSEETVVSGEEVTAEESAVPEEAAVPEEPVVSGEELTAEEPDVPEEAAVPEEPVVYEEASAPEEPAAPEEVTVPEEASSTEEPPSPGENPEAPADSTGAGGDGDGKKKKKDNPFSFWDILGIVAGLAAVAVILASLYVLGNLVTVQEKYQGAVWYESHQKEEVPIPSIPSYAEGTGGNSSMAESFRYGNSHALYATGSGIVEDKKYYYLADPTRGNTIWRVEKGGEHAREQICEQAADLLSLSDGRIYFATDEGICSITTDGTEPRVLTKGKVGALQLVNDWLYYIRSADGKLCKCHVADRREISLSEEDCNSFCVSGNNIYYVALDPERAKRENTVICRMNVDGGERMHLTEYGDYSGIAYYDGKLYYASFDEGYGMLDAASDVTLSAEQLGGDFVHLRGFYSVPVPQDGKIWYIDRSADRGIVCYDPESEERIFYSVHGVISFSLLEDAITYRFLEKGTDPCAGAARISTGEALPLY